MGVKAKKPRRVVLGVGHPWFSQYNHDGPPWLTVALHAYADQWLPQVEFKLHGLSNANKVRLVAEVLE